MMADLDHLCVGDTVELKKDKKGYKAKAELKFIGEVKDKKGVFYGVSVDKSWKGKHNGTFRQIKYFETEQQRGLFVTKDKMTQFIEKCKQKKRVSILDPITIPKLECNGVVRFIGGLTHKPVGLFYGVELQLAKGKNNGTVKGRTYFKCAQNCGTFVKIKDIEIGAVAGGPPPPPPQQRKAVPVPVQAVGPPPVFHHPPGAVMIESHDSSSHSSHCSYDYKMEPGYTDPGSVPQQKHSSDYINSGEAYPMQQPMMFNQTTNVMAMQQKLMTMQQDMINNPQMATQKWATNAAHNSWAKAEESKVKVKVEEQKRPLWGMFGDDYYQTEGMLRLMGCDEKQCQYYINRMKANGINDRKLSRLDTTLSNAIFSKIFPIETGLRQRFRAFIRYDIQGYSAAFRKEESSAVSAPVIQRKKSIFARKNANANEESGKNDEIVRLNIGGLCYATLRSTLVRSGSGFFKKLLKLKYIDSSNKKNSKSAKAFDERGSYFIDRDGLPFEVVLHYMQSGKLVINYCRFGLEQIRKEFKFYSLTFPKHNHKLPTHFRFEYTVGAYYYNVQTQTYDFMACDFRIFASNKKSEGLLIKATGIEWPQKTNDINQFLKIKASLLHLNYTCTDKTTYKCNDKEDSNWTIVENMSRYVW